MPRADRAAFRRFVPWSVRRAARVEVGAEYTRLDLLDLVPGLDARPREVIPYGVPPGFSPAADAAAAVRAEHGLEGPYVVFLGDLQPRKNLARLLEAWAIVSARQPEPGDPGAGRRAAAGRRRARRAGRAAGPRRTRAPARPRRGHGRAARPPRRRAGAGLPVALRGLRLPGRRGDGVRHARRRRRRHGAARDRRRRGDARRPARARRRSPRACCACSTTTASARRLRRAGLAPGGATCAGIAPPRGLAAVYLDVLRERPPARMPPRPVRERARGTVTARVVSTGEAERLRPCIDALRAQGLGEELQVVVVCNRPGDGSAELVREAFPDVVVVEQPEQRGFAENHNTGLAAAPSRFGLVLNPDVLVEPGAVRSAARADGGAAGVRRRRPAAGLPRRRAAAVRAALPGADRDRRAADAAAPAHRPPRRGRPLPAAARGAAADPLGARCLPARAPQRVGRPRRLRRGLHAALHRGHRPAVADLAGGLGGVADAGGASRATSTRRRPTRRS